MLSPVEIARRQLTLTTNRIHTLPVVVLMPHSRCNCRCVMCDIWRANKNGHELSPDQIEAHLGDFRDLNVRCVVLSGGEALMHPNLFSLCESLKTLNIKITLLSTGLLLSRYAAEVVRWCDEVIVSLDGPRLVHDEIRRVPRAFDRLADGVSSLRVLDSTFRVTGRCVVQKANHSVLAATIEAAHELDLDQISFLAADVSSEAFNRPTPWNEERTSHVALNREEVGALGQEIEEVIVGYADDIAADYVAESPGKLRNIVRHFAALNGDVDFPETVCNAPWVSTVVEADGTVRPCFFHRPLGNINQGSLVGILNSQAAQTFRSRLDVASDAVCRKCVCTLYLGPASEI